MSGQEYGIFFCANCGTTPYAEVSVNERPTSDCPTCGFDEWIFEPLESEWACYCNEYLPCTPSISAHCPKREGE